MTLQNELASSSVEKACEEAGITTPEEYSKAPEFFKDIWQTILEDSWMYPVIWGKPRTGKTTVQLKAGYFVYHDWDKVLNCIVYNLAGVLYKMKNGEPERMPTRNGLHLRVPYLIGDDWAAQNNKAKTQHEPAWDLFKGAFDTLGTKVAVFFVSMNNPSGITQQLSDKYTHEIYLDRRGHAKYDVVDWQQNYGGWAPRQGKDYRQEFNFTPVPSDIYKKYDEMRKGLVDELFQLIDDAMVENEGLRIFRRLNSQDVEFIEMLQAKGEISNDWLQQPENEKWKEVLKRCKARSIVVPKRKGTAYWYDLTDFGFSVYQIIQEQAAAGKYAPKYEETVKDKKP